MSLLDLWQPRIPQSIEPTYRHLMEGTWDDETLSPREKDLMRSREYYLEHKDRILERQRVYAAKNRAKINKRQNEWVRKKRMREAIMRGVGDSR